MSGWLAAWRALRARTLAMYGINRRNIELVYANNPRRFYPLADDKLLAKELLAKAGVPVPATLAVCDGLFAIPDLLAVLDGRGQFVVKPANGSGGNGILVVGDKLAAGGWRLAGGDLLSAWTLQRHLAEIILGEHSGMLADRVLVEPRIVPHPMFRDLWEDGLCDVRVITHTGRPVMAMVRVPTKQSAGKANLHQGGLGLAIELRTGTTFRALHLGRAISHHPESGAPLLGLHLPAWAEILDAARRAAVAVPLGYLGCDVVVDEHLGPLMLEINARPGLEIQNVHGYGLGRALAEAA